jgi:hypothetical protein
MQCPLPAYISKRSYQEIAIFANLLTRPKISGRTSFEQIPDLPPPEQRKVPDKTGPGKIPEQERPERNFLNIIGKKKSLSCMTF